MGECVSAICVLVVRASGLQVSKRLLPADGEPCLASGASLTDEIVYEKQSARRGLSIIDY